MAEEVITLSNLSVEEARENSLVDLAYAILKETNKPLHYREIMQEVAKYRQMSEEEIKASIAILYTEVNVDGRFLCLGDNSWGLKRWYPVDKTLEKTVGDGKRFIRKDDDDLFEDEDEELYLEEELDEVDVDEIELVDDEDVFDDVEEIDEEVDDEYDDAEPEDEEQPEDEEEEF
ncbi:DNA-directed RNA polymerase subunit delta [Effusibacillus dendaii]|uniref:Probable DNA-directed RNA polymerase subunit delta n=1 Tax=Effusibacillus dendaii TaxID=2743772 RepID=A0A7I8DIH7_9BACL|nr:DNA-directed RNA polymerase subunit delta [Effusibacillus dendaii]BCJ87641.1 hypothetical protein skT53_26260 [Effusibacillus dendaii]